MTEQTDESVYVCGGCSKRIGELVDWRGRTYLLMNGDHISSHHGVCACGAMIHFESSDAGLSRILKRRSKMKGILSDL